jgi:hypothetical protein
MLVVACATGSASHARQVKGDDPDKKGYSGPRGWGLGVRPTTPPHKKNIVTKPQEVAKAHGCRADDDDDDDVEEVLAQHVADVEISPSVRSCAHYIYPIVIAQLDKPDDGLYWLKHVVFLRLNYTTY